MNWRASAIALVLAAGLGGCAAERSERASTPREPWDVPAPYWDERRIRQMKSAVDEGVVMPPAARQVAATG